MHVSQTFLVNNVSLIKLGLIVSATGFISTLKTTLHAHISTCIKQGMLQQALINLYYYINV